MRALPRPRRGLRTVLLTASLLLGSTATGLSLHAARAQSTAAAPAAAPDATTLAAMLDDAYSAAFLADAQVGVSVVDLETGTVLYQRGDTTPLNPASNTKLVTTAAALGLLGPSHRYSTAVYMNEDALTGGTIKGDVYLRGSGDPALVTADLYELAGNLRAQGITKVTGGIVVDATAFDHDGLPPGFDQKSELAAFRAPSGATVVNFDSFEIYVRPGDAVGSPPFAGVVPPVDGIALKVEATTEAGSKRKLQADYEVGKDGTIQLTLRGTIGVDAGPDNYRYPVEDPTRYAGELLELMFEAHGIKVAHDKVEAGKVPKKVTLLATHHSQPLSVLIRSVNKFSNNFMAEQILKTLDADPGPATFEGALRRVAEHLAARGIDGQGMVLGNGSGLYDNNRVSAAQFTALLASVYADERIRPDFMASLAIMGVDGTTRSRLRDTPEQGWVRVKTGTLDGVSALSGYAGAPGRKPIAFCILLNGIRKSDTSQARKVQDRTAELLARYAAGQPLVGGSR